MYEQNVLKWNSWALFVYGQTEALILDQADSNTGAEEWQAPEIKYVNLGQSYECQFYPIYNVVWDIQAWIDYYEY